MAKEYDAPEDMLKYAMELLAHIPVMIETKVPSSGLSQEPD